MAVYVDNARLPFRRMKMCHMVGDTLEELHAFAAKIGIQQKWFQGDDGPRPTPHYDICLSKRVLAIKLGAIEVTSRQLVDVIIDWRERGTVNGR